MDTRQQQHARDYNAISPSAKALVLLKGLTNIPFAKETAILVSLPGTYEPDVTNTDLAFWKRVVHFEIRYWSLDQLLAPPDRPGLHLPLHRRRPERPDLDRMSDGLPGLDRTASDHR